MSRCSESGGSSSSNTPHTASNSFFEIWPAIRPAMMLTGRKRSFIAPGTVYPGGIPGTRRVDMSEQTSRDTRSPNGDQADGRSGQAAQLPDNPNAPESPTDLKGRHWKSVLKRTVQEFKEDNLTDWAAALTYYAVLALFPALIVLVALLGLVGQQDTINQLIDSMRAAGLSG